MARKHLQEIYGEGEVDEEEEEEEVTDEEMKIALNEIIQNLKEKYGKKWFKHIGKEEE
jgi:hypothetical protein